MKSLDKIKEMICDELDLIAEQGELTAGSLDKVDKLTHSLKSIEAINAMGGSHDTAKSKVMAKLNDLLDSAESEEDKKAIKEYIAKVKG